MKILDCTLRDGGYYTNWDFDRPLVDQYLRALNALPIDYIEVGYRSPLQQQYYGKYFYLPVYELKHIRQQTNKKLAIILNEKDISVHQIDELLSPINGLVEMVRMAIDPNNITRAIELAKAIKSYGFEVGFNVMYMSKWKSNLEFIEALPMVEGVADCFYMVDSYGGVFPEDVVEIVDLVRSKLSCPLGFHGHDNLEMALANSITAIAEGVEFIDSTILGMGRGAGNLKTELLLTVLNKRMALEVDFGALELAVSALSSLHDEYGWGTNLPYMISGSNSLPQKDVMDWVTTRFYSLNSIVQALDNKRNRIDDNRKFSICRFEPASSVLIVGGGPSISNNVEGIVAYLQKHPDMAVIHASSKNAAFFRNLPNRQYFCLVGNEGRRLENTLPNLSGFNGICVLPPYPRKMGTYVPEEVAAETYELQEVDFADKLKDAHTTLALQYPPDQLHIA
ncbi:aldolase catalytic domain-containing protein [Sphingobacterium hotanense]|uniref:aldolase catalytic domain-containing protein n=1 Tax=Sphingobacterium hotanense TaxID=649196 RepID=UPI0021A64D73|nr:aldolase catalytic domain-containing protein [Sphingobacterium hotanense]MCT1526940.1 aldolase catalytic domain-containing protein [Sphingobacterium hotanense]